MVKKGSSNTRHNNKITSLSYQATQIFTYRTKDGKGYFKFRYIKVKDNYWEIDIEAQPSYREKNTNPHEIYRSPSMRSKTGFKINIHTGKEPKKLQTAKDLSRAWAEYTWRYIQTGVIIDRQIERENITWLKRST